MLKKIFQAVLLLSVCFYLYFVTQTEIRCTILHNDRSERLESFLRLQQSGSPFESKSSEWNEGEISSERRNFRKTTKYERIDIGESMNTDQRLGSMENFSFTEYPTCQEAIRKRKIEAKPRDISLCDSLLRSYDLTGEPNYTSLVVEPKTLEYCPHPADLLFGNVSSSMKGVSMVKPLWSKFEYPARPYSYEHLAVNNVCFFDNEFHLVVSDHDDDMRVSPEDLLCILRLRDWQGNSAHWNVSNLFWKAPFNTTIRDFLGQKRLYWYRGLTYLLEQLWSGHNLSFWFRAVLHLFVLMSDGDSETASRLTRLLILNHPSEDHKKLTPWERGLLDATLGQHKDHIKNIFLRELLHRLWINEAVCFETLIIVPQLNRNHLLSIKNINDLREAAYKRIDDEKENNRTKPSRVTLIHRSDTRMILNEPGLVRFLHKKFGLQVHVVDLRGLTFEEQVETMSKTRILVGAHGAGLMNLVFLPEDSSVIELKPNTQDERSYNVLAELFHLRFFQLVAAEKNTVRRTGPQRDGYFDDSDFRVDINDLDNLLQDVL